ncbi:MAG: retroviral-like aspartic protease family protein [Candidatus Omnitrophica bacterium]|nr:retroviral-like aspartic protease family protein [Candidatus Omnitrophota bacterium]
MPRRFSTPRSYDLNPTSAIIPVDVLLEGPRGRQFVRMALDTGATYTMAPAATLQAIGYDPAAASKRVEFVAAGSIEYRPLLAVRAVGAFGVRIASLDVVAHDLPPQSPIRGLLGLNFLKHLALHLDFPRRSLWVSR